MKKAIILGLIFLMLLLGGYYYIIKGRKEKITNNTTAGDIFTFGEGGVFSTSTVNLIGTDNVPVYVATTTATTTSSSFYVGAEVDQMDFNIRVNASSTTSRVDWQYEFSYDGTHWFGEDTKTITSNTVTTHGAATTTHQWTPAQTDEISKNIGLESLATRYFRLRVFRGPNSATVPNNFAIWIKGVAKDK